MTSLPTSIPRTLCMPSALLLACCLSSCSNAPVSLDPFGRPYDTANAIPRGPLKDCTPKDADAPPFLESGTRPLYPVDEMLRGRTAAARLRFSVASDGVVTPETLDPDRGPQWFVRHAAIATRDWRVRPAMKDGKAVAAVCSLTFVYDLK